MKTIVFPVKLNAQGSVVVALHTALGLLGFQVDANEKKRELFGEKTAALIKDIQKSLGIPRPTGEVDQELAVTLNRLVGEKELIDALGQDGPLAKALAADGALARALGAEGALNKALGVEGLLIKALAADGALAKALAADGVLARALGTEGALNKALGVEGLLIKALAADGALAKALAADGALARALGAEGPLNKALGVEGLLIKALAADGALAKALGAEGELTRALGKDGELYTLLDGLASGQRLVRGSVYLSTGKPLPGCLVRAFHVAGKGKISLGQDSADIEGNYCIRYDRLPKSESVRLAVVAIDDRGQPLCEPVIKENSAPQEVVDLTVAVATKPEVQRWIEGQVLFEDGRAAAGLELRMYRRDFGGEAKKLRQAPTDEHGNYALSYAPGKRVASLEIRAVSDAGGGNEEEVPLSKPLNDLPDRAVVNLIAPSRLKPLAAEFRRLEEALKEHIDLAKLAEARESENQQDLTVLSRASGWDARLIALAATAARLAARPEVKLSREALYGLLRVGLPSDELLLAQVDPDVIEQALETAREAGVVELSDDDVTTCKGQFISFAKDRRLAMPAPGSSSSYGELLKTSGLSDEAQDKFASVYLGHKGDVANLWASAHDAKMTDEDIEQLRRQGKFAFVAANSLKVTKKLLEEVKDPLDLIDSDLHNPEKWVAKVREIANDDEKELDALIPSTYAADKTEDRLRAYAEDMARKVRLSYPTQVVNRLIRKDPKFKLPAAHDATAALLDRAVKNGFRFGETPAGRFFKVRMSDKEFSAAQPQLQQISSLQRVYQLTPSNEAMPVLLALKMSSAYDVMAYSEAVFSERYKAKYRQIHGKAAPDSEPELIRRRAEQVSSVTYNLFTIAKKLVSEPQVAGMAAPVEAIDSVREELIKQFPTMETLFGSMDFCECEHCRSVLSPAAYLVDLLQFIDPEPEQWGNFLEHWKAEHAGLDYPHKKPYDALTERRPDLPHISLTCENTNTALPYIDIVNEILEYYVANGKLAADAARDTGTATTAELLAEPQNIVSEAYEALNEANYPIRLPIDLAPETAPKALALPFDLWIETVRKFCDYFETPLAKILEIFRSADDLFEPTRPYDRAIIFMESLGLSPAEVALFTDADPLGGGKWHELYGFPRAAIKNPTNAVRATLSVANDKAGGFRPGLPCKYFDVSAGDISTESNAIASIGGIDSGGDRQTRITFVGVWTAPPDADDLLVCDASAMLSSAKTLSRRLGVTYKEITEIVQTSFVNPKLTDTELALLYKLGVSIRDAAFFKSKKATHAQLYTQKKNLLDKDRTEWDAADVQQAEAVSDDDWKILLELHAFWQRLKRFAAENPTPGLDANVLETQIDQIEFEKVLLLADPDAGCNFDLTTLQYADEKKKADSIDFLRINLFVRLWRKLGWSIEETDRALMAFIPKKAAFEEGKLHQRPLRTALVYLAHLKALEEKLSLGKQGRLKLIELWSKEIATTGRNPVYAQLFLNRAVLKSGEVEIIVGGKARSLSVFDDPLGRYLDPAQLSKISEMVRYEVRLPEVHAANQIDPQPFRGEEPKLRVWYDALEEAQYLSYIGVLSDDEKARVAALAPSNTLSQLLHDVQLKAQEFSLIKGHGLALQGPLGLTADEIQRILHDPGTDFATAELSLPSVSLLFRYGLLARTLKLSVRELIALKQLSGLDPFKQLHADPLATLDQDYPFSQTLEFVKIAEEIKDSGLKIDDLDYVLRHRFDEAGKYRPDAAGRLSLLKTLSDGVRAIRAEHAVPDDPGALSDDVLRQKLALVLPADVLAKFMSMMNGSAEFIISELIAGADQLDPADFAGEPSFSVSTYNGAKGEQTLVRRGILFEPETAKLKAKYDGAKLSPEQKATLEALLNKAQTHSQHESHAFFDKHLLKQPLIVKPTGYLVKDDYDLMFKPSADDSSQAARQAHEKARRGRVAQAFLPFLQDRLITQFIVQTMTAQTGADPAVVDSLISDARLLGTPEPLLAAYAAAGDRGVAGTYWFSADQSGVKLTTLHRPGDASGPTRVSNPVRSVGRAHAEIVGYLEVPKDDDYTFSVALAKKDDRAILCVPGIPGPLVDKVAAQDGEEFSSALTPLKTDKRYPISLSVDGEGAQDVRLMVKSSTLPKSPCESCRLEGYLQPTSPGAYRFHIELEKQNAEAELRFPHRPEPVFLKGTADAGNYKLEDYLELNAGVLYRFTLDLRRLDGGEARLLVQGETLPKSPLSALTLYSAAAIDAADFATMLLTKVLLLTQSLGLSERELRYVLTDGAGAFDNLEFRSLPSRDAQDLLANIVVNKMAADRTLSPQQATQEARNENPELAAEADAVTRHFKQYRRLAAYARLKRDLAGGGDDLIAIFEANALNAADKLDSRIYPLIAKLTRRDLATVRAAAKSLVAASATPEFPSEKPLQRLWGALQVIERFGVPVASLRDWTRIVSAAATRDQRAAIAHDLKEAIKARFDGETWRRLAQPIFDKLRQRQRDVLVSHVAHRLGFERMEQLYEHFLIDPGMEPVVQTSRIRLAIASVQLFIQRSLLNLEPNVAPSVINAKQWEWMRRYRVWEANRKIFLYPENWLEPEFRDDKTHLFTELEGALLQGDVSSDLVDDAFLKYLKKLDELARLDIVAMHIEDNADPSLRILHVIGRTYSQPHKYFYRRYAHQMWTPWEPVSAEIEGDHLAPVVWRDRLYLFWVTFMDKKAKNELPDDLPPTKMADLSLADAVSGMRRLVTTKTIEAHLHWSEYLQGEWSTHETGGFSAVVSATVPTNFDSGSVFIHVSKEPSQNGEERGVYIHLGAINRAFYLAGRNSAPEKANRGAQPTIPYSAYEWEECATRYSGTGMLTVEYKPSIVTEPSPKGVEFEFLLDARTRDLFIIKKNHTSTKSTEVHVLSAESGYRQFLLQTGTLWGETDATFEFLMDGQRNLYAIKKSGTVSKFIEVHVLSKVSGYRHFLLQTQTALPETKESFEFLLDERRDLYAIQKSGTASGSVEVTVLSRAKGYQKVVRTDLTALPVSDDAYDVRIAKILLTGKTDLIALRTPKGHGKAIQLKVLSADSKYAQITVETELPLKEPAAGLAFVQDGKGNLYAIVPYRRSGDSAEIEISSAPSYQKATRTIINFPRAMVTGNSVQYGILGRCDSFTLLPCDSDIVLGAPESASLGAATPAFVGAAVQRGLSEIASLIKPVFYQDNAYTLFMEPNVTERTIEEWQDWVTRTGVPENSEMLIDRLKDVIVKAAVPRRPPQGSPAGVAVPRTPVDPASLIKGEVNEDWLLNPVTGLLFDGEILGPNGRSGLESRPLAEVVDGSTLPSNQVTVHAGSGLAAGSGAVITDDTAMERAGLMLHSGGLNIVGSGGFNAALAQNLGGARRNALGAAAAGTNDFGR